MITKTRGKRNDASNLPVGCPEGLSGCICSGGSVRGRSGVASHAAHSGGSANRSYALGTVINQWQTMAERQDDIAQIRRVVVASALAIAAVLLWVGYLCLANAATGQASESQPGQAIHWKGPRLLKSSRVQWGARGVGGVA